MIDPITIVTTIINGAAIWLLASLLIVLPLFIRAARQDREQQRVEAQDPQAQVIEFPERKLL